MEKKGNTNLLLIALVLVLVIATITIVGGIIVMNNVKGKEPAEPKTQGKTSKTEVDEPKDISEATDFDLKFLKMENNGKNNIYSPLSIRYALYMLRDGADGETLKQIEDVLGDATKVSEHENIEKVLSFANGIFIRDTYQEKVLDEYVDKVKEDYDTEIKYDKFESEKNINDWIENKTLGQIKNLLEEGSISPDMEMALINALAIDMKWEEDFDSNDTSGRTFYTEDGKEITATTLTKKTTSDSLSYYKDSDVTAVSMDLKKYGDNKLSFIAIMPKEEKLTKYIEEFDIADLEKIENDMKSADEPKGGVLISIPKFKYDYSLNFKADLIKLGMKDAFNPEVADFSNMAKTELYVGRAIHSANIDFSEEGIKAAAVTVIMMLDSAMIEEIKPVEISIDKPFLYFIKDKESGEIWFVGTLYEPNKWDDDKADYLGDY